MGKSEPERRIRTLALVVLPLVASPLASKFRVPRSVQPPHGKLRPPLVPDAAPPVNRYRRSLSRSNNNSAVLAIVYILSTLQQWFPCGPLLARHLTRLIRAFSFRVHDRGFWPKPPKVVWSLLLPAGSEGPSLIDQTVAHSNSLLAALVLVAHYCRLIVENSHEPRLKVKDENADTLVPECIHAFLNGSAARWVITP